MDVLLDSKPDPLGLEYFFPFPRSLMSNATTGKLMPKPDFHVAKDLYNEIDTLTYRLKRLEDAAQVRWCHDASNADLGRLFDDAFEGEGIPVKNWGAFLEKGGVQGAMQFAPLDMIVEAINVLTAKRAEKIQLLYQITGQSDIMRGQATQRATATEQSIKAQFASTRVQTLQDEFARFAGEAQAIRAEIICLHFEPSTIIARSNVAQTQDAQKAEQAVALLQSDSWWFRIGVRPESISLPDMAMQRQERGEALQSLGGYFQSMMPLLQMSAGTPGAMPAVMEFVLETGQWMVAGLRGASEIEEAFDRFAEKVQQLASQPPPPPQPNPAMQVAQLKAQAEAGKAKAGMAQTQMDMQMAVAEHQMGMQKLAAEAQADRMKTQNEIARAHVAPRPGPGEVM
jgi:hypothetical protein